MIRKILFCLTMLLGATAMRGADGDWKLHPAFDADVYQIYDAPQRVYILALGQLYRENDKVYGERKPLLFVHDKSSGESLAYTQRNYLSSPMINTASYNAKGGYLCIVYTDGNIDLLYDNDRVVNIPGLKNATMSESKKVNSISFGLDDEKIYMSTDFGFVIVDARNGRIDKARNYHKKLTAIARTGDKLIVADETKLYIQDATKPLMALSDFNAIEDSKAIAKLLLPMTENRILASLNTGMCVFELKSDNTFEIVRQLIKESMPVYYSANKQGYVLSGDWALVEMSYDGSKYDETTLISQDYFRKFITSYDGKTYYITGGRDGIQRFNREGDNWNAKWTKTGTLSRPNAPAVFLGGSMTYSDKYGMLVMNQTQNRLFDSQERVPSQISGLKNGEWTNYGYIYTNPKYGESLPLPRGMTVDPNNPDVFFVGSRFDGLQIMDLSNPEKVITLGRDGKIAGFDLPGYISFNAVNLAKPKFDANGNLWLFNERDPSFNTKDLAVLPASAVKNKDYTKFIWLSSNCGGSAFGDVFPLKAYSNRNLVITSHANTKASFVIYDHKGTLEDTSDDRWVNIENLINQDGAAISQEYIYNMWEDEETGTLWVATSNGVFTCQPSKMFENPTQARRIKVARNDGTNLADYLLDGVDIRAIASDGNGNKWFATLGAGLVQTSSDGTHVMRQLTHENSYLPSNDVFMTLYNPANNSMMVGTMEGLAEYFVPGSSSGQGFDNVKVYPNPVRPDYVGYITIEGLMDNTLVKITDSEGNIVKELGSPYSGVARWDGTNIYGAKVNSGVYFVFTSRSGENASETNVAKILVVK